MTYQEAYDKLMKHAEQYPEFEATQRKLGMAISRPSKGDGKSKWNAINAVIEWFIHQSTL